MKKLIIAASMLFSAYSSSAELIVSNTTSGKMLAESSFSMSNEEFKEAFQSAMLKAKDNSHKMVLLTSVDARCDMQYQIDRREHDICTYYYYEDKF